MSECLQFLQRPQIEEKQESLGERRVRWKKELRELSTKIDKEEGKLVSGELRLEEGREVLERLAELNEKFHVK